MRYEELNWMDVEKYLENDDRLILVLGSTEQHGYLSLATDVKIPMAVADVVSQRTGVLVAPPLNYGITPYFVTYPGTISVRTSTYIAMVEDIVRCVYQQGFRRVLVLNGHGGNMPGQYVMWEVMNDCPGLKVSWYSWWTSNSVSAVAMKYGLEPEHANWLEAFPFTKVTDLPQSEKTPVHAKGLMSAAESREAYGDGAFGGKYEADPAVMDEMFAAVVQDVMYLLEF